MNLFQQELALVETNSSAPARPFETEFSVAVESFTLAIPLEALEVALSKGVLGGIPSATAFCSVLERLRRAARYSIRRSVARGSRKVDTTLALDQVEQRWHGSRLQRTLILPLRTATLLGNILREFGVRLVLSKVHPLPSPDFDSIDKAFVDGRTLDDEQRKQLRAHLEAGHSTIFDVAMAGGKTLLIAGMSR